MTNGEVAMLKEDMRQLAIRYDLNRSTISQGKRIWKPSQLKLSKEVQKFLEGKI